MPDKSKDKKSTNKNRYSPEELKILFDYARSVTAAVEWSKSLIDEQTQKEGKVLTSLH